MNRAALPSLVAALCLGLQPQRASGAAPGEAAVHGEADGVRVSSGYLDVKFSADHPALLSLSVDSLGGGRLQHDVLLAQSPAPSSAYAVTRKPAVGESGVCLGYSRPDRPAQALPDWVLGATGRDITFVSRWSAGRNGEPLTMTFDTHRCYATLLGLFDEKGDIRLPAVLHLPGFGSFRLSASGRDAPSLGYASGPGWIKVTFPAADAASPSVAYSWDVAMICPQVAGTEGDARYDGFRRNWLNIFQLNPTRRLLSNNTSSDSCGFCYYEYADIAF